MFSGTFYNDLSAIVGQDGTIITAADENHETYSLLTSWFTSALTNYMQDAGSDSNEDGKVTYNEALDRVKKEGGVLPNLGRPKSYSIPTLSEWKQIFVSLLLMSLVMGFVPAQSFAFSHSARCGMILRNAANCLVFDRQLFHTVCKRVIIAAALGLAGAFILFGNVSMLDIAGTLLCTPLVAYILHRVISAFNDPEGA